MVGQARISQHPFAVQAIGVQGNFGPWCRRGFGAPRPAENSDHGSDTLGATARRAPMLIIRAMSATLPKAALRQSSAEASSFLVRQCAL